MVVCVCQHINQKTINIYLLIIKNCYWLKMKPKTIYYSLKKSNKSKSKSCDNKSEALIIYQLSPPVKKAVNKWQSIFYMLVLNLV